MIQDIFSLIPDLLELIKTQTMAGFLIFIIRVVLIIATTVGLWCIFEKADEAGWKSLIPFYNVYILYKLAWSSKHAIIVTILLVILDALNTVSVYIPNVKYIYLVVGVALLVYAIIGNYKLSRAFSYSGAFTVGLVLLNPIFILILGKGNAYYSCPQE